MTASEEQVAAATMSTVEVPEETMSTVDSPEQMAAAASRRQVQALDSVRSPATAGAQKIQAMRTPKAERDRILRVRP